MSPSEIVALILGCIVIAAILIMFKCRDDDDDDDNWPSPWLGSPCNYR
jgi:hypothetical protein